LKKVQVTQTSKAPGGFESEGGVKRKERSYFSGGRRKATTAPKGGGQGNENTMGELLWHKVAEPVEGKKIGGAACGGR